MESTAEYKASVAVWQYCPPVLFVFGTFGNTMTIVILRRMNMKRSAMPVYLTALAVSDTCLLYTGLMRNWIRKVFQVDVRSLHSSVCKLHTWLVYSLIILSAWVLTFMTLERTVSVWRPHRVSIVCTRTKAIVIVIATIVTSLLVNCHLLYGVDLVVSNNETSAACSLKDPSFQYFFVVVWSWVDLTLASLLPFTLLLLGNCLILWKVSMSANAARDIGAIRPNQLTRRRKKLSSLTVTLLALSIIFITTTSPICVYNVILSYIRDALGHDIVGQARVELLWAVVNILMYINNTINFYLYCLSGAKFRKELKKCMCCLQKSPPLSTKSTDAHSRATANVPKRTVKNKSSHRHCRGQPLDTRSYSDNADHDSGETKTFRVSGQFKHRTQQPELDVDHESSCLADF